MKVDLKVSVELSLVLDWEEIIWLRNITQNPTIPDEDIADALIRQRFFDATSKALDKACKDMPF